MEALAAVAVDLVEGLTDGHPAPLELEVHQRQPVDEDRHVVAVRPCARLLELRDDLQLIAPLVLLIDQADVTQVPIIVDEVIDIVIVELTRLGHGILTGLVEVFVHEALPLGLAKVDAIECLQLPPDVGQQQRGGLDLGGILVALRHEVGDQLAL